jgi:hypothetical protein
MHQTDLDLGRATETMQDDSLATILCKGFRKFEDPTGPIWKIVIARSQNIQKVVLRDISEVEHDLSLGFNKFDFTYIWDQGDLSLRPAEI